MTGIMAWMEQRTGRAAHGLSLAAAPAFAAMAWISAIGTPPIPLCSASAALPIDAMAWMYALMCLFHLPPWLKRTARGAHPHAPDQGERQ